MYKPNKHRILLISKREIFTDDWTFHRNLNKLIELTKRNLNINPNWSSLHKVPVEKCYIMVNKLIYINIK